MRSYASTVLGLTYHHQEGDTDTSCLSNGRVAQTWILWTISSVRPKPPTG